MFAEVASETGLRFSHYNGMTGKFYLPEITGPGAALFDFDNDGDLDVFLVQGNALEANNKPGSTLFPWRDPKPPGGMLSRNDLVIEKDGTRKLRFTDVTEKSGVIATGYGMGVAAGDIDNDGWTDLYITNLGSNQMLRNNGNGTFTDVTKRSATDDPRWSTSAAFFDYDRDGWLDLFVANYLDFSTATSPTCYGNTSAQDYCTPRALRPVPDRLFHNRGNGTFEDVSVSSGITREFGSGLGVVTADFNGDGWVDIYVANDGNPNQLWINQKNGKFVNDALLAGAAVNRNGQTEAGMGVDGGDFDGDGDDDIFITHLMDETNTLFLNLGKAVFEDRTAETGLGIRTRRYTGFGTLWFDYDNDGWLDLLSANGAVRTMPGPGRPGDPNNLGQPNQLFHNNGDGTFRETSEQAGNAFLLPEISRGAAFGDVDNDGDTDVLIANNNGPIRLFLNQLGSRNRWIGFRLVGDKSKRDMLGARVEVISPNKKSLWRRARTDGGYCSSHDPRVLIGLGTADRVESVKVYWPDGSVDTWQAPPVGRYSVLAERGKAN
ncbi:MAG TPA: CRTAC1 family protein [Blastocatellia bacterium]|nr:CRTAC1 family protein [Blastocatellia bacterium]